MMYLIYSDSVLSVAYIVTKGSIMGGYPQEMVSFTDILFGYDIANGSQKDNGLVGYARVSNG